MVRNMCRSYLTNEEGDKIPAATAVMVALTGCDLGPKPDLARGQQLFTQNCGSCHTLTAAGTNGAVGPNLDFAFKEARGTARTPTPSRA